MLVGRDLRAQRFASLKATSRLDEYVPELDPAPAAPLTDDTLTPGVLYPSSAGGERVRFYLPAYRVATIDGSYAVRLRRRTDQDPAGVAGVLSVELAAERLDSQG